MSAGKAELRPTVMKRMTITQTSFRRSPRCQAGGSGDCSVYLMVKSFSSFRASESVFLALYLVDQMPFAHRRCIEPSVGSCASPTFALLAYLHPSTVEGQHRSAMLICSMTRKCPISRSGLGSNATEAPVYQADMMLPPRFWCHLSSRGRGLGSSCPRCSRGLIIAC